MSRNVTCAHGYETISVAQALRLRNRAPGRNPDLGFKCVECDEAVFAHKARTDGHGGAHFEHARGTRGNCSLRTARR